MPFAAARARYASPTQFAVIPRYEGASRHRTEGGLGIDA
jgi:hypothetical protein